MSAVLTSESSPLSRLSFSIAERLFDSNFILASPRFLDTLPFKAGMDYSSLVFLENFVVSIKENPACFPILRVSTKISIPP